MLGQKSISNWIDSFKKKDIDLIAHLRSIYGENEELIDERMKAFLEIAEKFREIYGEKEAGFARAPGRLNTLSMHSDHRGSYINPISLNKEIVICFAPRTDDKVEVSNANPVYGKRSFTIQEESPDTDITTETEWLTWTQGKTDERKKAGTNDDWGNKLKAVPVYLQVRFPEKKLHGFEGVMDGSIPGSAGLSSSSAIIVALMDIMTNINDIALDDKSFVRFCGIGEWYVGTRGGFGDQAAIKFGRMGKITHMTTLPELKIDSYIPFPKGYRIIIFNSQIKADKTGAAGQKFNEKTATYEIGEIYIRKYMKKHHADIYRKIVDSRQHLEIEKKFHLADVIECLDQVQIYKLIEYIPEYMTRKKLLEQLPEEQDLLKRQFATHDEPDHPYPVRLVIIYGLAECKRGRMLKEVLNENNVDLYGRLMNISHDGDRVILKTPRFDPQKDLYLQPGEYGCSISEIDDMVDIALESGAVGSQISGAGMGGSMMALVKEENVRSVIEGMHEKYYMPHGFQDNVIVATAIQGAGIL
jgi:N-acetylgalactosamine kinase